MGGYKDSVEEIVMDLTTPNAFRLASSDWQEPRNDFGSESSESWMSESSRTANHESLLSLSHEPIDLNKGERRERGKSFFYPQSSSASSILSLSLLRHRVRRERTHLWPWALSSDLPFTSRPKGKQGKEKGGI